MTPTPLNKNAIFSLASAILSVLSLSASERRPFP